MQASRSSFRDPAGYVAHDAGLTKRVITPHGKRNYDLLVSSGLYSELVRDTLIVDHREESRTAAWPDRTAMVIVPRQLEFISYPYEWSFHQLKDAAQLTLELQYRALGRGLSLKDASAYNVQFDGCRPIFIDTLSFEADSGGPWIAYEQFCRHFLGPLLLMHYRSADVGALLKTALDGFSVPWVGMMLPWRSRARAGALLHIHLHARYQSRLAGPHADVQINQRINSRKAVLDSLWKAVDRLRGPRAVSAWIDYRNARPHYSPEARASKERIVDSVMETVRPSMVYDLGANTGEYSRAVAAWGARCVALDNDAACVDAMYRAGKASAPSGWLLPLVMDISNPSPGLGVGNEERMSFCERGDADLTMVLGLVHHLRIAAGIPLETLGRYLARFSKNVLIEFVPIDDPMVTGMLGGRQGFEDYSIEGLAAAFEFRFRLVSEVPVDSCSRVLMLFERKS